MLADSTTRDTAEAVYLLEQRFRYTYATPVRRLRHRLVVVPPAIYGSQIRFDHGLTVSGSPATVSVTPDGFDNHVVEVRAAAVAEWIEFDAWALVGRAATPPPVSISDRRLLTPTALTRPDDVLAGAARRLSASQPGGVALAERVNAWVHEALTYEHDVTSVHTTAAAALAGGRGVCQDFAHVMLTVCRAAGLPSRYVSGHLVGEGGSHAWVEVIVADPSSGVPGATVAVAFDPTHNRRAGDTYLTVAVGRDYADVAPTSGTFQGTGPGVLSATKRLSFVASPSAHRHVPPANTEVARSSSR